MRRVVVGFAALALVGETGAYAPGPYASTDGKYTVKFPGAPEVTTKNSKTDQGELPVTVATYATSDGSVYMVSYTDLAAAPKPENRATIFAGVRDAVKGTGKQVDDKEFEFGPDKLPAREFVVDKEKQRIKVRAILRDGRLYQVTVVGTASFAGGKTAKEFLDSFELSK
jgi:hypothetical protein